ncbi:MAG: hypothetical protein JWQ22_3306 [Devosia sp.]|nr:hypothetical protein [Devosia sp.]
MQKYLANGEMEWLRLHYAIQVIKCIQDPVEGDGEDQQRAGQQKLLASSTTLLAEVLFTPW